MKNDNTKGDGFKLARLNAVFRIKRGMVFSLKENNENYFCREIGSAITEAGVNPPIGSELTIVKEPYKEDGGEYIDFTIKEDTKHYTTNRQTFKNSTKLISRKPVTNKKTVTSTGPFNGFDIKVKKSRYENYKYSNYSVLKVAIEFIGTFSDGQRVTSQAINDIKHATGFADKLKEIIIDELDKNKNVFEEDLIYYDRQKLDDFTKKYNGAPVETRYKYGKLAFDIYLTTTNYDVIKENIKKQVDCFLKSDTKNLLFLNKKY